MNSDQESTVCVIISRYKSKNYNSEDFVRTEGPGKECICGTTLVLCEIPRVLG
jgi:hypothetical protein